VRPSTGRFDVLDRFSAGLLAAMLERQPASLMSAVEEAVNMDLLVEDREQLRFRHHLLREANRQSLPQSLCRAMERQSASVTLGMGAAPAEVATQLARSAEAGTGKRSARYGRPRNQLGRSDASAAADLSKRAKELLPADKADRGLLLLTPGTEDHTVPLKVPKEVFGMCSKSKAQTDFHIFEGRGHSLTIDNGWKDVADVALQWLAANGL
jgi:hypothetical protein